MLNVIRLDFDPSTSIFGLSIRLETLAVAGALLAVLLLAALSSGRVNSATAAEDGSEEPAAPKLRRDDLILIAFGAVPGAVIGGRLGYALIHLDYYKLDLPTIADPGQGGYDLTLAVVLGTVTAIAVARLLAAPIDRWLGVAAVPVLLGLGLGKLATILGGAGQGSYSDASWATSYVGPGLWGSTNPDFAAVPSQAIEGGLVLAVAASLLVVPFLLRLRVRRRWRLARPGLAPRREWRLLTGRRRYLTAVSLWALARFAVAFTWRDARVLGPFTAEQLILLLVAAAALVGPEVLAGVSRVRAAMASRGAARRAAHAAAEEAATKASEVTTAAAAGAPGEAAPGDTAPGDATAPGEAAEPAS